MTGAPIQAAEKTTYSNPKGSSRQLYYQIARHGCQILGGEKLFSRLLPHQIPLIEEKVGMVDAYVLS